MTFEGTNEAIAPEINEPTRTNGRPSNASAKNEYKKFCQVKVNQLIVVRSDPIHPTAKKSNIASKNDYRRPNTTTKKFRDRPPPIWLSCGFTMLRVPERPY
jgi:hypothetical protein